jgi:TldD protein
VRVGLGGSSGFSILRQGEEEFEKKAALAASLLKAEPVEAGTYDVVLSPRLAGVFTHEAFGHFSEADLIEDSPSMRKKMGMGAQLGSDVLSIKDDPTIPEQLGFYRYDDEGVSSRPVQLMKKGVLTGRLHSRRTAAAFGEPLSGHCVAEDYRYPPIVRMGTIFIEPGDQSMEALLDRLGEGYYFVDPRGGQTSGESFTFGAQFGFRVRKGRLRGMVRDINLSGNLYATLNRIVGVGNDLSLSRIGGCGKGQMNLRSCYGAPHILVKSVVVGGA